MRRLALLLLGGCSSGPAPPASSSAYRDGMLAPTSSAGEPATTAASAPAAAAPSPAKLDRALYAWLDDPSSQRGAPLATEPLEARLPAPAGFVREPIEAKSLGAFLRGLPLAAAGTPVLAYDGRTILAADDANLAAVVAMDVGGADLQQCADSVIRLHAEWRWSRGARDHDYRAASGSPMPLSRFLAGERPVPEGATLRWEQKRKATAAADHGFFRGYLDSVFMFANTGSLARDAKKVDRRDLRAGDFFVLAGNPGHAVLVLDVARSKDGKVRALLGQGYMPAQRFHVLRATQASPWYSLDDEVGVKTPFWPAPFPWSSLRRLD